MREPLYFTFLFTDVEGSTRLWERHPEAMQRALTRHDALLREAIQNNGGTVFKTIGDAFCAWFPDTVGALAAALTAQQALQSDEENRQVALRVRMAIHVGEAQQRDGDFFGQPLNRIARLLAIGHGGQTLVSLAARDHLERAPAAPPPGVVLQDLGLHRLKDLDQPERVFQLEHPTLAVDFPPLRSLDVLPTNLPVQLTSFIGREREVARVKELLAATRLLTLTGAGGSGKTRLALQAAADLVEAYPDGVWFVDLAPLSDPQLVPQAVAAALHVREETGRTLTQALSDHLRARNVLLLLDNCEHLVEAAAHLAASLLSACPHLGILATSRERLNLPGERLLQVPTLSLPEPGNQPSLDALLGYEAVRLFVERAQVSHPRFAVTGQNAPSVARVCHRLDGIPLAIELAAARAKVLTVEQIAERLDDRFRLLTGGSRTVLPRQQTLRATVDWSYDLLPEAERLLLRRASVFAGGWTLEAAETVCSGEGIEEWEVLDLLTQLVDKSLVLAEAPGEPQENSEIRYRVLETLRQYGGERLEQQGEAEAVRARGRAFFLALAEKAAPHLQGGEQARELQHLDAEHDNLRAALESALAHEPEAALRLAAALWRFWETHGYASEGRVWLEKALAGRVNEDTAWYAQALCGAGKLCYWQGDFPVAVHFLEQATAVGRRVNDKVSIAAALLHLGLVYSYQQKLTQATPLLEESLALYRDMGDKRGAAQALQCLGVASGIDTREPGPRALAIERWKESLLLSREADDIGTAAHTLFYLGDIAANHDRLAEASGYFEECLSLSRQIGQKTMLVFATWGKAVVALEQERLHEASALLAEAMHGIQKTNNNWAIPFALEAYGHLAVREGRQERAALLLGAAEALREALGFPLSPSYHDRYERYLSMLRTALGEEAFSRAWEEGRALTPDAAFACALEELSS